MIRAPLLFYAHDQCATCRRARKWLDAHGVPYAAKPIRETPPTLRELRGLLAACGGERRRICNTSGRDYRELQLGRKLPAMSDAELLGLLAGNGNLIKRPVLLGPGVNLVGFSESAWEAALSAGSSASAT